MLKANKIQLVLVLIILIFLGIKIPQIDFRYGDENIYFQMGNLITQGQLPYQNFFLASPCLQILLIALVIFIFGFNIYLLKLIPLLCIIGSGFLIYKILACQKQKIAGLTANIFYLFSFLILTTSDYFSGIHLTVFLCLFSIYLLFKKQHIWAGIFSALALLTRFYAAPIVLALIIFILLNKHKRKYFWKFVLSSGLIFIIFNLILYLIFKQNYLQDVFFYHLFKVEEQSRLAVFKFFIQWDWPILILAGLSLFMNKWKKLILPITGLILTSIFLFIFKDIYYLYFNLAMPFIVILAGLLISKLLIMSCVYKKTWRYLIYICLIISISALTISHVIFYLQDHSQSARIDYIQDLNKFIINNSAPEDKIYGSFEIVPLIAVMTNRQIANNFIDTNTKTFSTGMFKLDKREKILKQEKVKFIIVKTLVNQQAQLLELGNFISIDFLNSYCQIAKTYPIKKDYYSNLLVIWKCEF